MKQFRRDIRLRALSALNIFDREALRNPENQKTLDEAIGFWARQELTKTTQLCLFFLLFSCVPTWEEVTRDYNEEQGKDVDVDEDSVKRQSRRLLKKLDESIEFKKPSSEKLRRWKP